MSIIQISLIQISLIQQISDTGVGTEGTGIVLCPHGA